MADIASRPEFVPRVPWRTVGVAFVIIALLTVAAVVYVGSQQNKVPPPFGVARNGSIALPIDGDIYTGDPIAGTSRALVTGAAVDRNPIFSRDGSKLAFFRQVPNETGLFHLAVTGRDGGAVTIVTDAPIRVPTVAEWSPDGTAILVNDDGGALVRYDTAGKAAPVVIADRCRHARRRLPAARRCPDPVSSATPTADRAVAHDADGTGPHDHADRKRVRPRTAAMPDSAAWSPDGRFIAFGSSTQGTPVDDARIYVMNADGTGLLQLDKDPGYWVDDDLVWSPDSTRIAFNRWHWNEVQALHDIRPIGVVPISGGQVPSSGSHAASEGALFDFAPDGTTILSMPGTLAEAFTWSANAAGTVARPDLIDVHDG